MKKRLIKILLLISLLLSVSCKNLFENSVTSDEDNIENTEVENLPSTSAPVKRTHVQISGNLEYNNRGAAPSQLNSILENANELQSSASNSERSASASVPTVTANSDCQYEYYIKATPDSGQAREVIASLIDGVWSYNITLEIGKTWTFEAGLRKKAQGTFGEADYVEAKTILLDVQSDSGHPFSQALTEETTNIEKTFILKPRQNGGYGKINLEMKKVPAVVSQMTIKIYDSNGVEQTSLLNKLEYGINSSVDTGNFIKSKTEEDNEYTFPSGTYDFIISFCQAYGTAPNIVYFPVYTTIQTVAVFDNMSTDTWKNGNPSAANSIVDSTGKFELTSAIIQNYVTSTLYVGKFSDAASAASDSNSGFPFEPLATLTGAFNKILANQVVQGSGKCDYRIILCENQTGNFEIPATILTSKVSAIDISGYNNTQKVINGGNSGTVLKISSEVPVNINHLQITGGNATDGGGINMSSGTKLTLGEGALVGRDVQTIAGSGTSDHGNYASVRGGGIYVHNATLILKNGSKVCNNYVNSSAGVHASGGGGISLYGGSLTIENGAVISWNNSANGRGGGILVPDPNDDESNASVLTMKGGEISHNTAGWYGGGVMLGHTGTVLGHNYKAKTFNFLGGTISENSISQRATAAPLSGGAGIFLDGGTFTMSGNAVIEKNEAILSDGQTGGGGIAISDSAEATGSFTMTGGIIRNNSASKGGALYFDDSGTGTEKSYSISGSASIPYGVDGTQGNGKNDVYIGKTGSLEIAAALNDTFPDTGIYSNNWKRGTPILKLASGVTVTEAFVDKLKCTFPSDDWEKVISSTKVTVNCPFYVGSYNGTAGLDTNAGTKISPYETIEKACQQMDDPNTEYIIKITGTTNAVPQEIPAALSTSGTYKAKSVSIIGVDNATYPPVINRGLINSATEGSNTGSALAINTTVPVTITNVKITGGWTTGSGGGIALNSSGTLSLGDGVVITGNRSDNSGGGVFVRSGTVFIYGSAQIGQRPADKVSSVPVANSGSGNCANWTNTYGGGIYAGRNDNDVGKVYLGYYKDFATNTIEKDVNFSGGIYYNYAGAGGGAICASGVEGRNSVVQISGGTIAYNFAETSGGGIYNSYGNTELYGGTIKENNSAAGGAISYINGSVALKGSLSIPCGTGVISQTNPLNDICITSGKAISLDNNFARASSSETIALTPETPGRNNTLLTGSVSTTNVGYFTLKSPGFKLGHVQESTNHYGKTSLNKIVTSIYVSASSASDPSGNTVSDATWNNSTYAYNDHTDNQAKPFSSIDKALQFITYQESASDYTIYITGTVTGQVNLTSDNSDTNNPIKLVKNTNAKTIKITGGRALSSGSPQDIISSGKSSNVSGGYSILVNTNVPVTFEKINIQGGKNTSSGGGIYISSDTSDVTLGSNTFVHDNYATYGAGIYNNGKLTVNSNAKIYSNTTVTGGTGDNKGGAGIYNSGSSAVVYLTGGDIYLNDCNGTNGGGIANFNGGSVFVYGSANIGILNGTTETGNTGSGIYNAAYLYLGYKSAKNDKTPNETQSWTGKIQYNAANNGGGINNAASSVVYMKSGTITANKNGYGDSNMGTGVYTAGTFTMTGGSITSNRNSTNYAKGGGVYIASSGTFDISTGATISGNSVIQTQNSYDGQGGAIYNEGTLKISGEPSIPDGATYKNNSNQNETGSGTDYNDIFLPSVQVNSNWVQKTITVGALTGSGSLANITLSGYTRGTAFLEADSSISDITSYKGRFTLNSDDDKWNRIVSSDKKKVYINAPIHVKSSSVAGNNGLEAGKSVQISQALSIIKDVANSELNHEIIINGTISSFTLDSDLNNKAGKIYIHGNTGSSQDIITGTGTAASGNFALRVITSVPVTLEKVQITGGNNTATDTSKNGGGINIQNSAKVTLGDGVLVYNNEANGGGGIYNKGTLTITGSGTDDDKRCIIKDNKTKGTGYGGGINNQGALNLEGYAKFINNTATSDQSCCGGAIYNNGTLKMKDAVEFTTASKQTNDIYLVTNKTIKLTDVVGGNNVPLKSIKITAGNHTDGATLVEDTNLGTNSFISSLTYFSMTTADTIQINSESDKGLLALGLIVTNLNDIQNAIDGLTADGDKIVLDYSFSVGSSSATTEINSIKAAIANAPYKVHLDLSKNYFAGKIDEFSNVCEISMTASSFTSGEKITDCSDLKTVNITGSFTSSSVPSGFGNTVMLSNCSNFEKFVFVDATSLYLENGVLNIWQIEDHSHRSITDNVIEIHIPATVTSLEIQDRFEIQSTDLDAFSHVKFVYEGTASNLNSVTIKRTKTNENAAWKNCQGRENIRIYYKNGGSYTSYKTWTPNANSETGTLN